MKTYEFKAKTIGEALIWVEANSEEEARQKLNDSAKWEEAESMDFDIDLNFTPKVTNIIDF